MQAKHAAGSMPPPPPDFARLYAENSAEAGTTSTTASIGEA